MSFDQILLFIIGIGILIGGIDKILDNKFGLGEQFEEGFKAMGPLALGMVGIMSLSPVIAKVLGPILTPLFTSMNADPAMLGALLANDMGGYALAKELAINEDAGKLAGLITSSMLGCTLVFSIPVGLGLISKDDHEFFAKGLLIGLMSIPVGTFVGGVVAGFKLSMVIANTIPIILLAIILGVGLKLFPEKMIRSAIILGKFITGVATLGLLVSGFQWITGIVLDKSITLIPGISPIEEQLKVVGSIGIVLLGTFPILTLLTRILDKPLNYLGEKIGLDKTSAASIIFTPANSIPVYTMMKDMNPKGKIINIAWLVPMSSALGAHLGFTAGIEPSLISAVLFGKLSAGITAFALAHFMTRNLDRETTQENILITPTI